ncbi:hypothetical protein DFQ14_103106 [Halopolyspora algeriensis]|uniref:FtsK domain-containing protein n=1 Tax=Halopolyspora algeriensis TaxID=1500506 RepID=A0A368VT03_9ACTN|nr:hypothetical protein [Halopolyspora algeriensis]RCW45142.1 hypothetical protein DFQ14_103106 [Halopolyspora algeriensis]TQM53137.1 hypothetical protein FHU43_2518 [Halopolyspora algeriensis]
MVAKTPPKPDTEASPATIEESTGTEALRQVRTETVRLGKRWRRQVLPLAVLGGTHGIGAASASLAGSAALVPVAAGWAGAAGAYGYAHRNASRWDRAYAGLAAVGSAGWQAALALTGADGITASLLWACGCALSVPYWVRHAEPDPDVTAELATPAPRTALPVAPGTADMRVRLWDEHMAAHGKSLPGSTISDIAAFDYGWKAAITLAIGEHWHTIMSARKAILSVYNLPDGRVFVEPIPGASVRTARITVLTSDPLQSVRRWQAPSLDPATGTFPIMTTADGELLHFRFFWPGGGGTHALVSGVNGSGKTKVLDLILGEAVASDRIVPMVVDGGEGASLPQWKDRSELFAETPQDARTVLRYALRLMDRRRPVLKRQGGGSIEPSPHLPLICIVIDEAHKLLMDDEDEGVNNKDIKRMCEKLTQEGRKFGISLVLATQVPSATQLGGSTVLRDQLKGGTVIGLRVAERTSGNMISSGAPMPEGLHELPAEFADGTPTRGLGYVLTSRMIRARSLLLEDPSSVQATETRLDPDSAAESVPTLDGRSDLGNEESTTPASDADEAGDLIQKALADGIASTDIAGLMNATGLTLGQIRRAVKQ